MKATLKKIIGTAPCGNSTEAAVAAAYWAGREAMRGEIVRGLIERRESYDAGRCHGVADRAMDALVNDSLLGGNGRDDSAEMMAWQFEIR